MAKRSLGPHWGSHTAEEQRGFVKIFTALMGRAYADNIDSYTSQNVLYARESADQNYAQVDTKILTENRLPLSINYNLHSVDVEMDSSQLPHFQVEQGQLDRFAHSYRQLLLAHRFSSDH